MVSNVQLGHKSIKNIGAAQAGFRQVMALLNDLERAYNVQKVKEDAAAAAAAALLETERQATAAKAAEKAAAVRVLREKFEEKQLAMKQQFETQQAKLLAEFELAAQADKDEHDAAAAAAANL